MTETQATTSPKARQVPIHSTLPEDVFGRMKLGAAITDEGRTGAFVRRAVEAQLAELDSAINALERAKKAAASKRSKSESES